MSAPIYDGGIERLPDTQYELNPFGFCGVFMTKPVMEKLAKLIHRHALAIREVLDSHKDELHAAHWTMATKQGQSAEYVRFVLRGESPSDRIKLFKPIQPEKRDEVFIVSNYDEAKCIADAMIAAREERDE